MKIRDIIDQLSQFDSDMEVVVNGYEDGFDSIKSISIIPVVLNYNTEKDYYGAHSSFSVEELKKRPDLKETEVVYIQPLTVNGDL